MGCPGSPTPAACGAPSEPGGAWPHVPRTELGDFWFQVRDLEDGTAEWNLMGEVGVDLSKGLAELRCSLALQELAFPCEACGRPMGEIEWLRPRCGVCRSREQTEEPGVRLSGWRT